MQSSFPFCKESVLPLVGVPMAEGFTSPGFCLVGAGGGETIEGHFVEEAFAFALGPTIVVL